MKTLHEHIKAILDRQYKSCRKGFGQGTMLMLHVVRFDSYRVYVHKDADIEIVYHPDISDTAVSYLITDHNKGYLMTISGLVNVHTDPSDIDLLRHKLDSIIKKSILVA